MGTLLERLRGFSRHYLLALLVTVIVVMSIIIADQQNTEHAMQIRRGEVAQELSRIQKSLESSIANNLERAAGFVAAIEIYPDMDEAHFQALGERVLTGSSDIRSIAYAPDMVVTRVYPLKGNEKAIGLDYRRNDRQRAAAFKVKREGRLVVTGPVDLVQGGRGLIGRFPVMMPDGTGKTEFKGVLSTVLDLEKLYVHAGLRNEDLPIAVAIRHASQPASVAFFGDPIVFNQEPVTLNVNFGDESWVLAAVPKAGWYSAIIGQLGYRVLIVLAGLAVVGPMFWAGRLMTEREIHIEALQEREDRLHALSHRLEIALRTSKIGVWEFHVNDGKLIWDDRMRDLYGVDPDKSVVGYEDWKTAIHPDDLAHAEAAFAKALKTGKTYIDEFRVITRDGELRVVRTIGEVIVESGGQRKIVGVNWNVTQDVRMREEIEDAKTRVEEQNRELDLARRQMEHNALHDSLTQLPNRRYLDQHLAQLQAAGKVGTIAILHIDLDRFKEINDTLGHAAGDAMLKHAARTIRACMGPKDFAARIGGDEFVIVSNSDGSGLERQAAFATRLIEAMSSPIVYEGHEIRTGISVGIAAAAEQDQDYGDVLINADIALYEAKRRGRSRYEFFTDALRAAVISTRQTADEILKGLEHDEFITWFQPQFDARTLEIAGVEALVRWNHPDKGLVGPQAFLPIAESLNVMAEIDQTVLEQALMQFRLWRAHGFDIPHVSVNISSQRLKDETLFERLRRLQIEPGTVCFELLESISFDDSDDLLLNDINRIKGLGIDIEIDDFGTGYASIVSLLKLSPKRLKIDRQLVMPLLHDSEQQRLVSSIIDIGRARGMEIVAEGVETLEHARILRDLGCHILQGYAFAKPMSSGDFLTFVKTRAWLDDPAMQMTIASRLAS